MSEQAKQPITMAERREKLGLHARQFADMFESFEGGPMGFLTGMVQYFDYRAEAARADGSVNASRAWYWLACAAAAMEKSCEVPK